MHLLERLWTAPRVWRYVAVAAVVFAVTGVGVRAAPPALGTLQIGWLTPNGATNVAHVDSNGNLQVGGTVNVGNLPSTQQVSGTVNAVPGQPSRSFSVSSFGSVVVGGQSASVTYAITSVTFANGTATPASAVIEGIYGDLTSDCQLITGVAQSNGPAAFVPAFSTVNLVFPQPFIVAPPPNPPGSASCLVSLSIANIITSVVGYRL